MQEKEIILKIKIFQSGDRVITPLGEGVVVKDDLNKKTSFSYDEVYIRKSQFSMMKDVPKILQTNKLQ